MQRDSARALLVFLYTDGLPDYAVGDVPLLGSLRRAATTFRLPRLALLCDTFLRLVATVHAADTNTTIHGISGREGLALPWELPPPTLARDLGSLVGDTEFADVRFIAEGRAIAAHRFVLENRCEYFKAMFRSGMSEGQGLYEESDLDSQPTSQSRRRGKEMLDVVVPDSFVGFLRLLIFIYTSTLPDGSDGALLEDLMAADRYGVTDMRQMCESMLAPSPQNWQDLLRAADLLSCQPLSLQVLAYLRDNYPHLVREENKTNDAEDPSNIEAEMCVEFPGLLERAQLLRRAQNPSQPPKWLIKPSESESEESKMLQRKKTSRAFPIWALLLALASMVVYQYVSSVIVLGPLIYIINISAVMVGFVVVYYSLQ
mmetsp:Transcript_32616/g.47042  ORF Transcript_32616/g.47042 Transcript_32616/m.47042 type:complete len:372 (-) Transcript_32616:187-1302(-)